MTSAITHAQMYWPLVYHGKGADTPTVAQRDRMIQELREDDREYKALLQKRQDLDEETEKIIMLDVDNIRTDCLVKELERITNAVEVTNAAAGHAMEGISAAHGTK